MWLDFPDDGPRDPAQYRINMKRLAAWKRKREAAATDVFLAKVAEVRRRKEAALARVLGGAL